MPLFADRVFTIDTENAFKLGSLIAAIEASHRPVIKLNLGEPDFPIPNCIKQEIKRQLDLDNTHYCDPQGLLSLREVIASQIYETRSLSVSPDQVVVFPGAKPSIGFAESIYCDPGSEILYPSPGYPIYESFVQYVGCIPKPLHLKEETNFHLSAKLLEANLSEKSKLLFLNFPSNPTGTVASKMELDALRRVILEKCPPTFRIYSDEIYEKIIFDNHTHHSIASLPDMASRTIISSGFSKSYAWTGGRIGYAVFPTVEEALVFKNFNINYFSCVPPYNQEAAKLAFTHPEAKAAVSTMVQAFEHRRNVLIKALRGIPDISCRTPDGAFYVFPNVSKICEKLGIIQAYDKLPLEIRQKTSPSTLLQLFALHRHQVAVMDRPSFGRIGSENEHFIRLSATIEEENLIEGVTRLSQAFEDKKGFQTFIHENRYST